MQKQCRESQFEIIFSQKPNIQRYLLIFFYKELIWLSETDSYSYIIIFFLSNFGCCHNFNYLMNMKENQEKMQSPRLLLLLLLSNTIWVKLWQIMKRHIEVKTAHCLKTNKIITQVINQVMNLGNEFFQTYSTHHKPFRI